MRFSLILIFYRMDENYFGSMTRATGLGVNIWRRKKCPFSRRTTCVVTSMSLDEILKKKINFLQMFQIFNPGLDGGKPRRRKVITNEIADSRRLTSRCDRAHNINDIFLIDMPGCAYFRQKVSNTKGSKRARPWPDPSSNAIDKMFSRKYQDTLSAFALPRCVPGEKAKTLA